MFFTDILLSFNTWFAQLTRVPKVLFLISIMMTPLAAYFHTDETNTIAEYVVNLLYRFGFMMLVFFVADFFRTYFQTFKLQSDGEK